MRSLVLSLLLLLSIFSAAMVHAAPLDSRVEELTSSGAAKYAMWGVYAVDAESGKVYADVNGTRLLTPASNRKVVTTAMIARLFKPDSQLRTDVTVRALSPGGIVEGDLVVHAVGDPSWTPSLQSGRPGTTKLRELARMAKAAGVVEIRGDVVIDTRRFVDPAPIPPAWIWEEFDTSYASRPSVLAINSNLAPVKIAPQRPGQPLEVQHSTAAEPFKIINASQTLSAGAGPTLILNRALDGSVLTVSGGVAAQSGEAIRSIPVGNPVVYTGELFAEALRDEGIRFSGNVRLDADASRGDVVVASVLSAPMADILKECNEESDNFLAESLYLLAGAERYARASYKGSYKAEDDMWKSIGVDSREVVAYDGSGLSRKDAITPHALATLLREMRKTDWFVESLPVSGRTGTLRYRLADYKVQAKTGTLDGASALSGYVKTASGKTMVFSIMANNYTSGNSTIRKTIDDIVATLAAQ